MKPGRSRRPRDLLVPAGVALLVLFGAALALLAVARGLAALAGGAGLATAAVAAGALWLRWRGRLADRLRRRDRALAELARREQELSLVVKSVQELLFRTDAGGALTFVNARWQAATGRAESELLGHTLADLVDPGSRAAVQGLVDPAAAGTRTAQVRLACCGARPFEVAVAPLREGGRLAGFVGSAVDITERLAAQARAQQELAFSDLVLDTMPVPIALVDRDSRYLMVNRAWEAALGVAREALVGQRSTARLPPEEAALHEKQDREVADGGGPIRFEAPITRPDGRRAHAVFTKVAVPAGEGRPAGVLISMMDITERHAVERASREARDAAEEASRAKSEFIANISHELRTPLQAIIGFSELGQMRGRQHEKLASMFGDIHAAGQRMLALVNDLLDVSKIESTVGTFHLERTDLRPLVREVAHELGPLLSARRLQLALELGDVPLVAKVDPMRFQQVVRNVLANAVKFSPEGSAIDVEGDLTADSRILLSVRDRGPGIPPKELEKIFEAFVQSSKTKDGSGGTGLGLAICRKIVEAHGGRIVAENAEGGGSRFTLSLPARGFVETVV